ncbi:hypothetical protein ADN00_18380 [Ornatilinea apprima]|uniref:Uncharacterized protein n=1 Tax=Ornatilinea apprima TaxID=1134406 RepID=A0A0P6X564_9CHLR|nr:immune inhibitor A domain-containing protein [Ornatilinea apprima]KPL70031.1 hypothetical protein ADN00_18380 [Ornatilinea apprima]
MDKKTIIILVVAGILVCCCLGALAAGVAGSLWMISDDDTIFSSDETFDVFEPEATPVAATFTEIPLQDGAYETLNTLLTEVVPNNDLRELASRLGGSGDIPETMGGSPTIFRIGDQKSFFITNGDTNETVPVNAILEYETEHVYFWVEEGVEFDADDLKALVDEFETKIYPTNRAFFGSEWTPGIDNDPHLFILYANGIGSSIAGYFSSADSVHPLAHKYSNAHEMFLLSAENVSLEEEFTYGVLAHEFQHMIHWYRDRNEDTWLNEGFSELASFLNGYDAGGFDYLYASQPDLQLNDWPNDSDATTPHYGSSFLFVTYFLDRFGEDATKALVAHPDNGMDSIDAVLAELGAVDSRNGELISADALFADWVVANYLQDASVEDGRFTYTIYDYAPTFNKTETVSDCDGSWQNRNVSQYGVDYVEIACAGSQEIRFEGEVSVPVLPQDAYQGKYAFWSNKGDESDMTLTQQFDFSNAQGTLTLNYWTWYDLEEDYDYLYLVASEDGENWKILKTPSGTDQDLSGNSYGWGYNGTTDGWIQESVDISQFAGKKVFLRFEYVTDAAVNGEGLLLDMVEIPEIGYQTDFETDEGGWNGEGFVRIENVLPQTFRVSLIQNGNATSVGQYVVFPGDVLSIPVEIEREGAVLVVSGTTRFTRQEAIYRFAVGPQE